MKQHIHQRIEYVATFTKATGEARTMRFTTSEPNLQKRGLLTVYDQLKGVDADALADDLRNAPEYIPIPDYAFDCHTRKGKASGATKAQFFSAEHAALQPFQPGLFDGLLE